MASKTAFQFKHITASTVVAGSASAGQNAAGPQAILHTVTINSAAATAVIQVFDDVTTSGPARPITGPITAPAGGFASPVTLIFDCEVSTGITVTIATAAADVTVVYA